MKVMELRCLKCDNVFEQKVNGIRLQHNGKDNSITLDNKKLSCTCGCTELIFNDYYNVKLKYPR